MGSGFSLAESGSCSRLVHRKAQGPFYVAPSMVNGGIVSPGIFMDLNCYISYMYHVGTKMTARIYPDCQIPLKLGLLMAMYVHTFLFHTSLDFQ